MKRFRQLVVLMMFLFVDHSSLAAGEIRTTVITVTVEHEGGGENAYTDKLIAEEEVRVAGSSRTDTDHVHANTPDSHEPALVKEPYADETRPSLHMRVMPQK